MNFVLLANAGATLFMVGVIWFVQVVHYPLFSRVGQQGFALYSRTHARLTGFVVGPPMLVEAATAALLVPLRPAEIPLWSALLGLVLVGAIWASTALLQAPRHSLLGSGFDREVWGGLVLTNWFRTAAWSARGLLVLWMLYRVAG